MKTSTLVMASTALVLAFGCASPPEPSPRARAAAAGAATGAVIGGVIGKQSGETGEGAALGAAAGAAIGAASASDRDRDRPSRTREIGADPRYASDDYMRLMTPSEVAILQERARASGRARYQLTDFLTSEEKENLRRRDRDRRTREIGRR